MYKGGSYFSYEANTYSTKKCELPHYTLDADGMIKMIAAIGG